MPWYHQMPKNETRNTFYWITWEVNAIWWYNLASLCNKKNFYQKILWNRPFTIFKESFVKRNLRKYIFYFIVFSIWVFFHKHSRFSREKRRGICLTPLYHFHPLHRHLEISRGITAESSPLHTAGLEPGTFGFRAQVVNH